MRTLATLLCLATIGQAQPLELVPQTGHTGSIWGLAMSEDGKLAITSGDDGRAFLWDVATGKALRSFTDHTAGVYGVAIRPDGTRVVTASDDKTAILWDAVTGKKLRTFAGHSAE